MSRLFFYVEGQDDSRFIEFVVKPLITQYDSVHTVMYAQSKLKDVERELKTIKELGDHLIFMGDQDDEPSVTVRVAELRAKYTIPVNFPVIIVCREIEGWYLAGVPDLSNKQLWNGSPTVDVNTLTKEDFNRGKPTRFYIRQSWMIELLKKFNCVAAESRSISFAFSCQELNLSFT
jgi:hypothetical protein